jgi:hypothetical protein
LTTITAYKDKRRRKVRKHCAQNCLLLPSLSLRKKDQRNRKNEPKHNEHQNL